MSSHHHHDHHHYHPENYNRTFVFSIILNIAFAVVEVIYGYLSDSVALIADAGHNFSDVISLLLAWGASVLATSKPTKIRTYGYRRVTILASLISAIFLLVASGGIAWEAMGRFYQPAPTDGLVVVIVAGIGVVINAVTALLFFSGQRHDLNIKAAYLHMMADAGVSLGVVVAGLLIIATGWIWLDPTISLIIVGVIMFVSWRLFRDSMNLSIDAVPENIDPAAIEAYLLSIDCVVSLHDLHIWGLSTSESALTVHLVVDRAKADERLLAIVSETLARQFGIEHATIQVEDADPQTFCKLDRPECME